MVTMGRLARSDINTSNCPTFVIGAVFYRIATKTVICGFGAEGHLLSKTSNSMAG